MSNVHQYFNKTIYFTSTSVSKFMNSLRHRLATSQTKSCA